MDKFIEIHIVDSGYNAFHLDFLHAEAPNGRKPIDLSPYPHILSQLTNPSRLFKGRWVVVEYVSYEQFLHDASAGCYALRSCEIGIGVALKKLLVPLALCRNRKQKNIYLI